MKMKTKKITLSIVSIVILFYSLHVIPMRTTKSTMRPIKRTTQRSPYQIVKQEKMPSDQNILYEISKQQKIQQKMVLLESNLKTANESLNSWYNYFRFFFNNNFQQSRYYWSFIQSVHNDIVENQYIILITRHTSLIKKQKERIGILLWLLDYASAYSAIGGNKKLENHLKELIDNEKFFAKNILSEIIATTFPEKEVPSQEEVDDLAEQLKNAVDKETFKNFWTQRSIDKTYESAAKQRAKQTDTTKE